MKATRLPAGTQPVTKNNRNLIKVIMSVTCDMHACISYIRLMQNS